MIDTTYQEAQSLLDKIVDEIPESAKYGYYVDAEVAEFYEPVHKQSLEYWKDALDDAIEVKSMVDEITNLDGAIKLARLTGEGTDKEMELRAQALDLITKRIVSNHMDFLNALMWAKFDADIEMKRCILEYNTLKETKYNLIDENIDFKRI